MTYYTRSSVKNRKGRYQQLIHFKNSKGKWDAKTRMCEKGVGKRQAEKMAEEWRLEMNALNEQMPAQPNRAKDTSTVDDIVRRYLQFQLSTGEIEQVTYDTQIRNYNRGVSPYIGDIGFYSLDKAMIMDWLTELANQGLMQSTIYGYFKIPRKVYTYYLEEGEININPFDRVKSPPKGKPNITHLTSKQVNQFIEALNQEYSINSKYYAAFLLSLLAGLRRGEICGLRWRNVEKDYLLIDTSVAVSQSGTYTKLPKGNQVRRIPIVEQLSLFLQKKKEMINPRGNWFVCGDRDKYMSPTVFNNEFASFVRKYDLVDAYGKKLVPHGLRHNFAAVGIAQKVDIAALSKLLGHSSIKLTLDTYGDALEESKIQAAAHIGEGFDEIRKHNESDA